MKRRRPATGATPGAGHLPEVGDGGQEKLARFQRPGDRRRRASGSPVLYYLAGAGIGRIDVVDSDVVAISNLHRQILYATPGRRAGEGRRRGRAPAGAQPGRHRRRASRSASTGSNIDALVGGYDVVVDCPDNLATRYVVNEACWRAGTPLVEAAVLAFSGMLMTIVPPKTPCYRCLYPIPPKESAAPSSAEVGIMGMVPGVIGSLQALEAVKLLLGIGSTLAGRVLFFDGLEPGFEEMRLERNPDCAVCGRRTG